MTYPKQAWINPPPDDHPFRTTFNPITDEYDREEMKKKKEYDKKYRAMLKKKPKKVRKKSVYTEKTAKEFIINNCSI